MVLVVSLQVSSCQLVQMLMYVWDRFGGLNFCNFAEIILHIMSDTIFENLQITTLIILRIGSVKY